MIEDAIVIFMLTSVKIIKLLKLIIDKPWVATNALPAVAVQVLLVVTFTLHYRLHAW